MNKRKDRHIAEMTIILMLIISSCGHYSPKPHGFPKVQYPDKEYVKFDTTCPYTFEIPAYAKMKKDEGERAEDCWYNLHFPSFQATLNMTYKSFNTKEELYQLSEDAYRLAMKHDVKAVEISETEKTDTNSGNTVMIYDIGGKTASPFNFYITDNKKHFLRGAFYFDNYTEGDSIAPIYDFIKLDLERLIYSTKWKSLQD